MPFMTTPEREFARAVSELIVGNPFLPAWIEAERRILGADFVRSSPLWHTRPAPNDINANLTKIDSRVAALAEALRQRLAGGADPGPDGPLYESLIIYLLYGTVSAPFYELTVTGEGARSPVRLFRPFADAVQRYLGAPRLRSDVARDPAHLFAFFFQIRRAFRFTIENILGGSLPAARLRAAVWQAIFTHDMRRYLRSLWERMHDVTTLIVGPSGTGKELVAQAIGLSRHIPFDPSAQRFTADFRDLFFPLSLSALPSTLIESELFGHRRGAFTGAMKDRRGWLETCPPLGTVFLDEIAEIEPAIQVKLLRVLQSRVFQRVGDTDELRFPGKIVAATNRDLAAEMRAGRFRPDLYYRLCSDVIETPSLAAQLRESPGELPHLLHFLARRIAGEAEAGSLGAETEEWITQHLGRDYPWPGNVRELEQCVRNVMVRGEYRPPRARPSSETGEPLAQAVASGSLTADELLRRYCVLVYARTGSYVETARRLGLDRRTVKDKVAAAAGPTRPGSRHEG